ncbi:TPA: hypothetical protein ACH3X3_003940 [Trebouxia sp. C0006]
MKAQTRADLVQLAQDKLEDLQYLSHVSEQMRAAVDMACVVEGMILPVHSYVLMSASPVLSDIIASHFSGVIQGSSQSAVLSIPLIGTKEQTAKEALQYVYTRCVFKASSPQKITSTQEAERLANFAHKYNIQSMLEDADAVIHKMLLAGFKLYNTLKVKDKVEDAEAIIDWAELADEVSLTKSLEHCEAWLVIIFKQYHKALPKLLQLRQEMIARIMQKVADRLPH